jgi:hypothetical protein
VLAVASHFLEFIDLEHPQRRPILAHGLRPAAVYAPVLTTGAGLWRYRLGDQVRCVGLHGATPMIRFEGRVDTSSDVHGEKLDAALVSEALGAAAGACRWDFAMLVPRADRAAYVLITDASDAAALGGRLEVALRRVYHYDLCRRLGQLGPVEVAAAPDASRLYQAACVARGMRAGDIKPPVLDPDPQWVAHLTPEAAQDPGHPPKRPRRRRASS